MEIKIKNLVRKQQPSKYKPGETYTIVNILSEDDKPYSAMGSWTDSWKDGDTVNAEVVEKRVSQSDGSVMTFYNLKNPNQSQFGKFTRNTWPQAYALAIEVIKNVIDEETLDAVAARIKEKIDK